MLMAVLLLAAPLTAEPQTPPRTVRIGWLGLSSPGPEVLHIVDGFKQGLRELGYVEGRNVAFEYRWAHGRSERLPELAAELVLLKMDLIAVGSTVAALAAKQATPFRPWSGREPTP